MVDLIFQPCENCSTFIQQITYINNLTDVGFGGIIGLAILLMVGFLTFLMAKSFASEKVLSVSMTITSFIGVLLGILGLLADNVIYICLIFLIISLFMLFKSDDGY